MKTSEMRSRSGAICGGLALGLVWTCLGGFLEGCAANSGAARSSPAPTFGTHALLGTYFLDNGQDGVYLCSSTDGETFEPLLSPNVPILTPSVGQERLTRDACIMRGPDQRWHMVWTTGWWEQGFGLAHSGDLVHWTQPSYVTVMREIPGTVNCWAPEIVFDPDRREFVIFWSSTVKGAFPQTARGGDEGPTPDVVLNHRIYCTRTQDFERFSSPKLMVDPGFNCIDATLLPRGDGRRGWTMFLKDETRHPPSKNIRMIEVARLPTDRPISANDGTPVCGPITGLYWAEGPSAVRVNGAVRVYFDRYADDRFGAVESDDLTKWRDISDRIHFPPHARHTTVVWISRPDLTELKRLLAARSAGEAP